MNWTDSGFLISKNKYNENSIITEIFTLKHGKVSGIIFGATSNKIKNYLQLGNLLHINYNSKTENRIGYFKVEIIKALSPIYFDHHQKLSCITSAIHLIKILTAESQSSSKIYYLLENFYLILESENWVKKYIFWELELFKILGYDLELVNLVDKEKVDNKVKYIVKSKTETKIVPNFLVDKSDETEDLDALLNGLKLVGDFLDKTILKPNNQNYPVSRLNFLNTLK